MKPEMLTTAMLPWVSDWISTFFKFQLLYALRFEKAVVTKVID
jgi:hypothetical protein